MQLPSIVPPPHGGAWPDAMADTARMNWMRVEEAARFAAEDETAWPHDLPPHLQSGFFEPPPFNEIRGPVWSRGPANGLVLRRCVWSRPLGRRHADPRRGPGPHRPFDGAPGRVERAATIAGKLDRRKVGPVRAEPGLRFAVVAHGRCKSLPERGFFASGAGAGAGGNVTWVAPREELVAVPRWTDPTVMVTYVRPIMQAIP